jgi:hypothetical protein
MVSVADFHVVLGRRWLPAASRPSLTDTSRPSGPAYGTSSMRSVILTRLLFVSLLLASAAYLISFVSLKQTTHSLAALLFTCMTCPSMRWLMRSKFLRNFHVFLVYINFTIYVSVQNMQRTLSHLKDINRNLRTEIRSSARPIEPLSSSFLRFYLFDFWARD